MAQQQHLGARTGLAVLAALAAVCWCPAGWVQGDDSLVQFVLKQPVNVVSDEFVSFTMDPLELMANFSISSRKVLSVVRAFSPAYLKIAGANTNKLIWDDGDDGSLLDKKYRVTAKSLETYLRWANTVGLKTVITLPYEPNAWSARDVIKILGAAKESAATECIWQLGSNFNGTDVITYVDDLSTLRQMVDAFEINGWGVIGADISTDNYPERAQFYIEIAQNIVDSTGWIKSSADTTDPHEDANAQVLHHSKRPVWLNFDAQSSVPCTNDCTEVGLEWAHTLGTSAQQGFSSVFRRIFNEDILQPTLSAYVSVMHKKLMGNQVFDTRVISSDSITDRKKLFAHCSRNISGAFTVMGVNFGSSKEKIYTKLPIKSTGSMVLQYVITTNAQGSVLVNGESIRLGGQVEPIIKTKKPNRLTSFLLQEKSVSFWVFSKANIRECLDTTGLTLNLDQPEYRPKTSSERLLQELIAESIRPPTVTSLKRQKRHLVVKKDIIQRMSGSMQRPKRFLRPNDINSQYRQSRRRSVFRPSIIRAKRQLNPKMANIFEKFELGKKNKKFQLHSLFKKGPLSIPPVVSTIQDVYKVSAEDIFKSSENVDLPKGDVYLEVGEDKTPDYDYVAFEEPSKKPSNQPAVSHAHYDEFDEETDHSDFAKYPNHLHEGYTGEDVVYSARAPQTGSWEAQSYSAPMVSSAGYGDERYEPGTIVQAVEPTWQENQKNLRKAKSELDSIYMDHAILDKPKPTRKVYKTHDSDEAFFTK